VGGIVIGIGGFIFPRALGTGYDVIYSLINGNGAWQLIAGVLNVKSIIWSFSLGSGTSGGILAPLLMIGGALGALFAPVLPTIQAGAWPLAGMAAVLSGAIGCPLTGAVLTLELTHNYGLLLPVLASSVAAHAFTVLFQKRSILTERISRRGHHLSREYGVDPLEVILVSAVMRSSVVVLPADTTAAEARLWLEGKRNGGERRGQGLYPVVDAEGRLASVTTRRELTMFAMAGGDPQTRIPSVAPVFAHPEETLRTVAERMATSGLFAIPVVERETQKLLGLVTAEELLKGREWAHFRENKHERLRMPFRRRQAQESVAEMA
jgi:CBS domain-containing protein